jgi:hypothetical protein
VQLQPIPPGSSQVNYTGLSGPALSPARLRRRMARSALDRTPT